MKELKTKFEDFLTESKLQEDYRDFFTKLLELYDIKSPAQLKGKEEIAKKFYKDITDGWSKGNGLTKYGKKLMEIDKLEDLDKEK